MAVQVIWTQRKTIDMEGHSTSTQLLNITSIIILICLSFGWVIFPINFPNNAPLDLKPTDLHSVKFLSRTIAKVSGCEGLLLFMGIGFEWSYNDKKGFLWSNCFKIDLQNTPYLSSDFSISVFFSKEKKNAMVSQLNNYPEIFKEGDYFIIIESISYSNPPYAPRKRSPNALMDFPGKLHIPVKSVVKEKNRIIRHENEEDYSCLDL